MTRTRIIRHSNGPGAGPGGEPVNATAWPCGALAAEPGATIDPHSRTSWSVILVGGRGFADTRARVYRSGRRNTLAPGGAWMRTQVINGITVTDRAGAAEYLGIPLSTVRQYAKPSERRKRGWPEPVQGFWYALHDLDTYRAQHSHAASTPDSGDADDLLTAEQFAVLRGVQHQTMIGYIQESVLDWDRGQDGLLPVPDRTIAASHGLRRLWKRSTAHAWTFPAQPRRSTGRPTGPRPTTQDLAALLTDAAHLGEHLRGIDIAARLSQQFDHPVSLQTVRRLQAKLKQTKRHPG